MTDLSKLAAERCAELGKTSRLLDAFRQFVEQAHTLATEALAHPERATDILAPLILVDPDLLIAREAAASVGGFLGGARYAQRLRNGGNDSDARVKSALAAIRLYRQREGCGNG